MARTTSLTRLQTAGVANRGDRLVEPDEQGRGRNGAVPGDRERGHGRRWRAAAGTSPAPQLTPPVHPRPPPSPRGRGRGRERPASRAHRRQIWGRARCGGDAAWVKRLAKRFTHVNLLVDKPPGEERPWAASASRAPTAPRTPGPSASAADSDVCSSEAAAVSCGRPTANGSAAPAPAAYAARVQSPARRRWTRPPPPASCLIVGSS